MHVPAAVINLHESHVALHQTPRHQAAIGEGAALARIFAVKLEGARRLFGEIGQFRHRGLHPERHFVLRDAHLRFGIGELLAFRC